MRFLAKEEHKNGLKWCSTYQVTCVEENPCKKAYKIKLDDARWSLMHMEMVLSDQRWVLGWFSLLKNVLS